MTDQQPNKETAKDELDIVSFLANPTARGALLNAAASLKPVSNLGKLLMIYYVSLPPNYAPEAGALRAYLLNSRLEEAEITLATVKLNIYTNIDEKGTEPLIETFYSHVRGRAIMEAVTRFYANKGTNADTAKSELIEEITEISKLQGSYFPVTNLGESYEALEQILKEEIGDDTAKIPSRFGVIRESSSFGAYLKGWVVQVNAPPGVGKTLFMMNECAEWLKTKKVAWVALGDMHRSDFIIRLTSIIKGISLDDVTRDPMAYIDDDIMERFNNLRLSIHPAKVLSASEVVNNLLSLDFEYDVVVIDYDDNFRDAHGDNMYKEGGATYQELTRLANQGGRKVLVMVASQVKQFLWDTECLPENCSASSSQKQAVIDTMITINRNTEVEYIGTLNIPKQRRGKVMKCLWKRGMNGEFTEIPHSEYQSIKGLKS